MKPGSGEKPQIKHLRTFGCAAYAYIPDEKTKKLDDRGKLCCFIGYNGNHQFRMLNLDTGKVEVTHDIRFLENQEQFVFMYLRYFFFDVARLMRLRILTSL